MKKIFFFLITIFFIANGFAFSVIKPSSKKATEIFLSFGNNQISLKALSLISIKDFQKLTGKHLNLIDKIYFKIEQKKIRNSINNDETVNTARLFTGLTDNKQKKGFSIGWFAIGFMFLGIGVLLAYLIKGDKEVKHARVKSAWIGFGVFAVIFLIMGLAISSFLSGLH